jgi:hypothetical protein
MKPRNTPSRYPNPLACWWVGDPAVCNLKGGVTVPAHHTDFWYLTGGLARTHNGMYFPKYIILIAMMFVFISALQGGAPVFQVHWHSPSLLWEDYCYATVCTISPPRELRDCRELEFCELRLLGILRSSPPLAPPPISKIVIVR